MWQGHVTPVVTAQGSSCAEGSKGSVAALGCSLLWFWLCSPPCCSPREIKPQWPEPGRTDNVGVFLHPPPSPAAWPCRTLPQAHSSTQPAGAAQGRALVFPETLLGDIPASPRVWGHPHCVCHPMAALIDFPQGAPPNPSPATNAMVRAELGPAVSEAQTKRPSRTFLRSMM